MALLPTRAPIAIGIRGIGISEADSNLLDSPDQHSLGQGEVAIASLLVSPVGCVAVAHDGRQTLAMLLLRKGASVTELLTRLDLAIAKAFREGTRTDEVNPLSQLYFPKK